MQGYSYRLRLINAIAIECPVVVSIDRHEIIAIATDGTPVKPVAARSVQLYPGNVRCQNCQTATFDNVVAITLSSRYEDEYKILVIDGRPVKMPKSVLLYQDNVIQTHITLQVLNYQINVQP